MIKRRKTRTVKIANVKLGSGHPILIQSMTKVKTSDIRSVVSQVRGLEKAGCEIIRVAVKDLADANAIFQVKKEISIPLVADIHFNWKLAVRAIEKGADKIRINPGNISNPGDINKIIDAALSKNIPIRIGVNSGSLKALHGAAGNAARTMVGAVLKYLKYFEKRNFKDIVISLKASEVPVTVEAYQRMAEECDYPLHLGVTATGLIEEGIVKSAIGIGSLLLAGIGDTIRVSLTGESSSEVDTARIILKSLGLRKGGPQIISCPTCGRSQVDLVSIVKELEKELKRCTHKPLTIAVMGCEVNGPGEARCADIGIAFGKGKGVIFRHGEIVKMVETNKAVKELIRVMEGL